ncbi:MAG TPA: hypothetical protein VEK39_14925 [Solirubrobacterales bacterium]|nr:hypothetical protein [Solirubrobacterales bacterium]
MSAILGVTALGGCGGGGMPTDQQSAGPAIDAPLELADCSDWNAASLSEKLGTVRQIRETLGAPTGDPGFSGATLDDQDAYDLFESACEEDLARGFKLYKLYARAAAFGGPP